jgi:hypothetical protein
MDHVTKQQITQYGVEKDEIVKDYWLIDNILSATFFSTHPALILGISKELISL